MNEFLKRPSAWKRSGKSTEKPKTNYESETVTVVVDDLAGG
jgi:hypothetical protein